MPNVKVGARGEANCGAARHGVETRLATQVKPGVCREGHVPWRGNPVRIARHRPWQQGRGTDSSQ